MITYLVEIFVSFCGFSPPCDLTNSAPYDTLAKPTTPRALNEAKKALKMLQRHSEDTPQQLHSILTTKKQFYIYSYIKNLFLIYSVSTDTGTLEFQCLTTPATMKELVTI